MTKNLAYSFSPEPSMSLDWSPACDRVAGELVHKKATEQIFLTGGVQTGELRFLIDAAWPSVHSYYRPDAFSGYDGLLIGETLRQATYYVTHTFCDVPLFWSFILGDLEWHVVDQAAFRPAGEFLKMTVELTCARAGKWTRLRTALRVDAVFRIHGKVCATASLLAEAVDPRIYQSLRRRAGGNGEPGNDAENRPSRNARRLAPRAVGRRHDDDVVIGGFGSPASWSVLVDCTHPIMFDHPLDHLPGMLLLEAGRQAGFTTTETIVRRPVEALSSCRTLYTGFCELGQDTLVHAEMENVDWVDSRARVRVRITQREREAATGSFEYSFRPAADR
jgi:hypothetical protein